MDQKTVTVTVKFTAKVPADTDTASIWTDINYDAITLMGEDDEPIDAQIEEHQTVDTQDEGDDEE